jgi:hypothetical protein
LVSCLSIGHPKIILEIELDMRNWGLGFGDYLWPAGLKGARGCSPAGGRWERRRRSGGGEGAAGAGGGGTPVGGGGGGGVRPQRVSVGGGGGRLRRPPEQDGGGGSGGVVRFRSGGTEEEGDPVPLVGAAGASCASARGEPRKKGIRFLWWKYLREVRGRLALDVQLASDGSWNNAILTFKNYLIKNVILAYRVYLVI